MRLGRMILGIAAAMASGFNFDKALSRASESLSALAQVMRNTKPSQYASKPNRVSQAKRRKYKRQGRK